MCRVVAKAGVTLNNGLRLPEGVDVGIASHPIHHAENVHDNAAAYGAFRISKLREASAPSEVTSVKETEGNVIQDTANKDLLVEILENENLAMASTRETSLPFWHGGHDWPIGSFALTGSKLLTAQMMKTCDIKALPMRPPGRWVVDTGLPPLKATILIKRRKAATSGRDPGFSVVCLRRGVQGQYGW
ncbi:hypothetical protein MMC24_001945 [Lignoscripta atroalba]|nr:hypothetical protein [Lignoscripta atroalba]